LTLNDFEETFQRLKEYMNIFLVSSFITPPDVSGKGLKFYLWTFFFYFFLFYQSTLLSRHAVDGHRMYLGGWVIGRVSAIGRESSPTPALIFNGGGGQKVQILASFKTSLNCEPHEFENAAKCPNSETKVQCCDDRNMSW